MDSLNRVIILGDSEIGGLVSDRVKKEGLNPVCVGFELEDTESIVDFQDLNLKGQPGSFELLLHNQGKTYKIVADFLLISYKAQYRSPLERDGILPLERFLTNLPDLGKIRDLVFLDPFHGKAFASRWQSLFDFLTRLELRDDQRIHIVSSEIKVARDGLELVYKQLREKGILFYKPDTFTYERKDGFSITFYDHILNKEIQLTPDLVISMDEPFVPLEVQEIFTLLKLETDNKGFPQADNVLRLPFYTNRKGVYVISPILDQLHNDDISNLISSVINEIKTQIIQIKNLGKEKTIEYNQHNCAYCLTCYRVCPHSAIVFESKPNFMPLACEECGICVSNCPGEALTLVGTPQDSILEEIAYGVQKGYKRFILACRRSGKLYLESIRGQLPSLNNYWLVELPCAGFLDEKILLQAYLIENLEHLIVLACKLDNCRTTTGTLRAERCYQRVLDLIRLTKGDPSKLSFLRASSQDFLLLSKFVL